MSSNAIRVRPLRREDYVQWRPLWDGYNAFYGREGATALAEAKTQVTWERFFDPAQPMHALAALDGDAVIGLVHYLFHLSTTRPEGVCYLQDLFTLESQRGRGVGRALIERVYIEANAAGCSRAYWQTHESNAAGRALYDKAAKHFGFIVYSQEL